MQMQNVIDSPGSEEKQHLTNLPAFLASQKSGANDTAIFRSGQSHSIQRDTASPELLCFTNGEKRQSVPAGTSAKATLQMNESYEARSNSLGHRSAMSEKSKDKQSQGHHEREFSRELNVIQGKENKEKPTKDDQMRTFFKYSPQHKGSEETLLDIKTENDFYTEVFSWGSDRYGQLGLGVDMASEHSYSIPRFCSYNITIRQVSCGQNHAGFITQSNFVYTMGSNSHGQLGIDEPTDSKNSPCLVELPPKRYSMINCGGNTSFVCSEEGTVYSWGQGRFGQLGSGKTQDRFKPEEVNFKVNTRIIKVSAGLEHTAFLDVTGRIFVCGSNEKGQLGLGNIDASNESVLDPVPSPSFSDCAKQLASGSYHTLVLSISGLVYVAGLNNEGQLGDASRKNSALLKVVDEISHIPMKFVAAGSFSAAISEDKMDLFLWGTGSFGEFLTPHRVKKIKGQTVSVSVGYGFGVALSNQGYLYSWGMNDFGQLGSGDFKVQTTPQLMTSLESKLVTSIECGQFFAIGLGQTLRQSDNNNI